MKSSPQPLLGLVRTGEADYKERRRRVGKHQRDRSRVPFDEFSECCTILLHSLIEAVHAGPPFRLSRPDGEPPTVFGVRRKRRLRRCASWLDLTSYSDPHGTRDGFSASSGIEPVAFAHRLDPPDGPALWTGPLDRAGLRPISTGGAHSCGSPMPKSSGQIAEACQAKDGGCGLRGPSGRAAITPRCFGRISGRGCATYHWPG